MVMLAYYKNKSITKNELLKVIEKSYLTSNVYIDTAIKKGFFRIIRNEKDKRSIFILPSVITIKTFEGIYRQKRYYVYRDIMSILINKL
jgi:DNA-binding MarR family transcriptional regulator